MILLDLPQVPLTLSHLRSDHGDTLSVIGYVDAFTVPTLQPAFLAVAQTVTHSKSGSLTVDLSGARFIDRSGLEMLLGLKDKITAQDCTLVIRLRPGSQPETIIHDSKLDTLLSAIYETAL